MSNPITAALLGLAVGDALGVPVEFMSREALKANPVTDVRGYGTHHQPPGTWSDDASLTFCLAESLLYGYHLRDMAQRFIDWSQAKIWTPHGRVFDIGITTSQSIRILEDILTNGEEEQLLYLRYEADEYANGNGSLMRILPLVFVSQGKPLEEQFERTWQVSALTHGHIRAAMACFIYLRFANFLLAGADKYVAYANTQAEVADFFAKQAIAASELAHFDRVLRNDIHTLPESAIKSDGYVVHSLEASLWALLRNDNYRDTILAAINLGNDTDTTAAIAGGLAGILYTPAGIPANWLDVLVKKDAIIELGNALYAATILKY
ncbi:MAG: ADP-ribosylglycohydrolase family protein [Saprospiraceae bacterium]